MSDLGKHRIRRSDRFDFGIIIKDPTELLHNPGDLLGTVIRPRLGSLKNIHTLEYLEMKIESYDASKSVFLAKLDPGDPGMVRDVVKHREPI